MPMSRFLCLGKAFVCSGQSRTLKDPLYRINFASELFTNEPTRWCRPIGGVQRCPDWAVMRTKRNERCGAPRAAIATGTSVPFQEKQMYKMKTVLFAAVLMAASLVALTPEMAQAHSHKVCHWEHHHQVCHWVH
jgi:hypothetical protein